MHSATRHQLDALLGDSDFRRTVDLIAKEVYHVWNMSDQVAHGFVLSAIGEPDTLACVHAAFSPVQNLGLARVIIRRRVIDLLRKDARPNNHCSLPTTANEATEIGSAPEVLFERPAWTPQTQLELSQVGAMVRTALSSFAEQGTKQRQQAQLLQRYVLEEVDYTELSVELTCSKNALRVRVHKAIVALRRYVEAYHPELEQLLERRSLRAEGDPEASLDALDGSLAASEDPPDASEAPGAPEVLDPCPRPAIEPHPRRTPRLARGSVIQMLPTPEEPPRGKDRTAWARRGGGAAVARSAATGESRRHSFAAAQWQEHDGGQRDATNRARGG